MGSLWASGEKRARAAREGVGKKGQNTKNERAVDQWKWKERVAQREAWRVLLQPHERKSVGKKGRELADSAGTQLRKGKESVRPSPKKRSEPVPP